MIDKKNILFERDDKGQLVPQEVELVIDESDEMQLPLKGEKIAIVPISRGELKRMFAPRKEGEEEVDLDDKIISEHCVNPSFTLEEAAFIKPPFNNVIINTIFVASGLERRSESKQAVEEAEDEFSKNLEEPEL